MELNVKFEGLCWLGEAARALHKITVTYTFGSYSGMNIDNMNKFLLSFLTIIYIYIYLSYVSDKTYYTYLSTNSTYSLPKQCKEQGILLDTKHSIIAM